MKLYYYDHCPFCVRTLMLAHYKNIDVEKNILQNDDVETCMRLINSKQVPILEFDDKTAIAESLEIAHIFDEIGTKSQSVLPQTDKEKIITSHIFSASKSIYALLFPRNVKAGLPEFSTQSAINYFQTKKEKLLGMTFDEAIKQTQIHKKSVEKMLKTLPNLPEKKENLKWDDVMIFPHLRNLTIVKDLYIPETVKDYIEHISHLTNVHLYFDRAL
ncbi:glutaredoxin 2 [Bartonella tamiae]|uniref:GrxB family glutaredoxin n=1 Tax=Bartonella tamiae Th239 TaxID=1094558 RepID=J0QSV1_9HYPH|nr:glutaredoxin 2 [Bartonella tamiae]EJF88916.1 GrxB family glutaredoxin [Bartonella tamiae Th239]EJF94834.1 GrxB family glutaredoxin [Bartonella tamiae Th307]